MSPDLFNYYTEIIMRDLRDMEGVKVGGTNINNIRYADDTVLLAESQDKLQDLVNTLNRSSRQGGLTINKKKTEVMVVSKEEQPPQINILLDAEPLKQTDNFNYLGSTITCDGKCEMSIKKRIVLAKNAFCKD